MTLKTKLNFENSFYSCAYLYKTCLIQILDRISFASRASVNKISEKTYTYYVQCVTYNVLHTMVCVQCVMYNVDTTELVAMMKGHQAVIHSISVHTSGRYAITTSSDTAQLWDLDSFQRKRKLNVKENIGIVKVGGRELGSFTGE